MALTWHSDEWQSYLDLRTGEVRQRRSFPLGDEREDHELSEDELETGLAEDYRVHIEPLPSSVECGWMEELADTVTNARLRVRFEGEPRRSGRLPASRTCWPTTQPSASAGFDSETTACGRR